MEEEKFACGLHRLLSLFRKEAEVNYPYKNYATKTNVLWVEF